MNEEFTIQQNDTEHSMVGVKGRTDCISHVALSPNGEIILTGSPDGIAFAFNAHSSTMLSMAIQQNPISSITCSADNDTIFVASYGKKK